MDGIAIALVALVVGVSAGAVLAGRRRPAVDPDTASGSGIRLEAQLQAQFAELRRLADAEARRDLSGEQVRAEVSAFREALAHMQVREQERRAREEQGWDTLHRVSAVLAGGQRTGRAGENVLREALSTLPPPWWSRTSG